MYRKDAKLPLLAKVFRWENINPFRSTLLFWSRHPLSFTSKPHIFQHVSLVGGTHSNRATPLVCLRLHCPDLVPHSQLSRLSLLSASVSLTHWASNWIVQEGKGKGWEVSGARQKTDYLQTGNWKVKMQRSRSLGVRWCPAFGTLGQEASGWPGLWLLCKPGKHSQCHILPGTTWEVLHIVYF